jgi:hypothetical protein
VVDEVLQISGVQHGLRGLGRDGRGDRLHYINALNKRKEREDIYTHTYIHTRIKDTHIRIYLGK